MTTFLSVPYNKKNIAKEMGAFWSKNEKLWYIPDGLNRKKRKVLLNTFSEALPEKIHLNVEYNDKDDVKFHGGKWDVKNHKWFIPRNCNKENYKYLINTYPIHKIDIGCHEVLEFDKNEEYKT